MRLTRRCKMPGTPASYRCQTGTGKSDDPFVVPVAPKMKEAIEKLGRYEDTGLDPDEIIEILKRYPWILKVEK